MSLLEAVQFVEVEPPEAPPWTLRLFSRGQCRETPVDVVPPRHEGLHALLVRWGAWARARTGGGCASSGLASIEGLYRKVADQTAGISAAPAAPEPVLVDVERVMLRLPAEVLLVRTDRRARRQVTREIRGLTLRLIYVERWAPSTVCSVLVPRLRPQAWQAHVTTWRAMVQNGLRALRA